MSVQLAFITCHSSADQEITLTDYRNQWPKFKGSEHEEDKQTHLKPYYDASAFMTPGVFFGGSCFESAKALL